MDAVSFDRDNFLKEMTRFRLRWKRSSGIGKGSFPEFWRSFPNSSP